MPQLGALLVTLFAGLAEFFVRFMSKKLAVTATSLTVLSTVTLALMAVFNSVVAPLAAEVFSNEYGQFLGLIFPPVAGTCLASMGTIWTACTLYGWQTRALSMTVQA